MKGIKQFISLLAVVALVIGMMPASYAKTPDVDKILNDTAQVLLDTASPPQYGSVGGEWLILGMARSGMPVPKGYYPNYYRSLTQYVDRCGGVLHTRKYTEYARVVLALSALGVDGRRVGGYDLVAPLYDYETVTEQGVNGPIYALLALDSRNYPVEGDLRQRYIDAILACRQSDGGWSLSGTTSDPDVTGMALQALGRYQTQPRVKAAVTGGLACLSNRLVAPGGFASSESYAQMLVALCELGMGDGQVLADGLLEFYVPREGFRHSRSDTTCNTMATEQAFYALVALKRQQQGRNSLYRMTDGVSLLAPSTKHAQVRVQAMSSPGKTFSDTKGHANQTAIEALARYGMVSGTGDGRFDPDATLTRAEFAAMMVNALGLPTRQCAAFSDVAPGSWYASYVGTACSYGIVSGVGGGRFAPDQAVTLQEAACMVSHGAKLSGLDTRVSKAELNALRARLPALSAGASWAGDAIAFCYGESILTRSDLQHSPTRAITRGQAAQMLYHLLTSARLM